MSNDFKDLILKMFSYDPSKRPTVEEIKNHPWMKTPFSQKLTRQDLLDKLQTKRSEKTADSTNPNHNSRGQEELMLDFVRPQKSDLDLFKFNDMTDHDIDVSPGDVWEQL